AAIKLTTRPRKVRKLGFTPVAASEPTILSSSHLLPLPIPPVSVAMRASFTSRKSGASHRTLAFASEFRLLDSRNRTLPALYTATQPFWRIHHASFEYPRFAVFP